MVTKLMIVMITMMMVVCFRILSSIGAGILGDGGHVDSDDIRLEIKDHLVLDLLLVDMIKTLVG